MKTESKANLIFVTILIILMVPGVFMLVRRKLNGDRTSAALPDPVPYALAYNQPPPTPPGLPRMEPPFVRDWVQQIVREKIGIDTSVLRNANEPIVSDAYFTQALSVTRHENGPSDIWLMIWRDAPTPSAGDPQIFLTPASAKPAASISIEPIDVPKDVRHALQGVGYIDPPPRVWLGHWQSSGDGGNVAAPKQIQIKHPLSTPAVETIPLP